MYVKILSSILLTLLAATSLAQSQFTSAYVDLVDERGNISLPEKFQQNWTFLGSWAIDNSDAGQNGAAGFHNVYTQPGVVDYFNQNGSFPDGAMVIKELLASETGSMTTGTVSHVTEVEGWFVMVKDAQGRFNSNPLWGDGWGWALFNADQPETTVSTDYQSDCLSCHIPAQQDDWIYLRGYPLLLD